jgi:hypothetical protein
MVKIPIGKRVIINLWDTQKKRGLVKYLTDTMDLVRAESEFILHKGDTSLVVESFDSFVVIVPEDEYTQLLHGSRIDQVDLKGINQMIWKLLSSRKAETGGILSFEEVWSIFHRSSIQNVITRKHLKKALKLRRLPFDHIKFQGGTYLCLNPTENAEDVQKILQFSKTLSHLTVDQIQVELGWSEVRITQILAFLVNEGRVRIEDSYRTGVKYYFVQLKKLY